MRTLVSAIVDDDGNDHPCHTRRGACRCRTVQTPYLLAAELAVRDAVGQRARTDAYHRRDAVRAALRLPNH